MNFKIPRLPRSALGPVLFASLFVLLVFAYRPSARPEIAPPWALPGWFPPEWSHTSGEPQPTPVEMSGESLQRVRLELTSEPGLYDSEQQMSLADELEGVLNYSTERFGDEPADTIKVYFGLVPGCNLNGVAYTDQRVVQVFTCPELPRSRAVNILAHEFVHQLAHDHYSNQHLQADMILAEGLATYGAGRYWLGDQPDFASFVRHHYMRDSELLPLATSYVGRSTHDMNKLYYQWGSFVEFLLQTYGRESFDTLYVSGANAPGSADYAGVYGKSLPELEQEWHTWLEA